MAISLADLEIIPFVSTEHNVSGFDCGDDDLNDFLKTDAAKYQTDHLSHTRIVLLNGALVGYITLLTDCIILQTSEKKKALDEARAYHQHIYTFPAVKIGRIGIQKEFQRSGIGKQLLIYTIGVVFRMNRELNIACRFITLDAYPQSVPWYEKHNFIFNKHYRVPARPQRNIAALKAFFRALVHGDKKAHPSMRYDLLKSPQIT
jgi:GNAT superfamily N-acetyltransferase